ncbi:MAG: hypothetical protein C3F11_15780 [Methylocystaceae bacterium]|nr:MAG: hypothetical protein C3F11_15780 [Methylocystaceae bacterium]
MQKYRNRRYRSGALFVVALVCLFVLRTAAFSHPSSEHSALVGSSSSEMCRETPSDGGAPSAPRGDRCDCLVCAFGDRLAEFDAAASLAKLALILSPKSDEPPTWFVSGDAAPRRFDLARSRSSRGPPRLV